MRKKFIIFWLVMESLALVACSGTTTYGRKPQQGVFNKDIYEVTIYYNVFSSKYDIDRRASEEIKKLMNQLGYVDFKVLGVDCSASGKCTYQFQMFKKEQVASESPAVKPNQPQSNLKIKEKPKVVRTGSGFVISRSGQILTASHVIEECGELRVPTLSSVPAELIQIDPKNDLALIQVRSSISTVATFREGQPIRSGDSIVAVGYPLHGLLSDEANVTAGNVSAMAGIAGDTRFIQITAPVQPGSSGGPLLDSSGNIIGVVVSKLDALKIAKFTGDIPQNINFAIKASIIRNFLDTSNTLYSTAESKINMEAADIGQSAKSYTVFIECWK